MNRNRARNVGCITVLLVGAATFVFDIIIMKQKWGSSSPVEQNIADVLMALTTTLGGLWFALFPLIGFKTYLRTSEWFFYNKEEAKDRAHIQALTLRFGGVLMALAGILLLVIKTQELLILLGIVK